MADYFSISTALITSIPLTSWCNEMIFREKIEDRKIINLNRNNQNV
jgi:hypothetical protein